MNPAGHYEGAVALVNDITALHESQMQGYLRATILDAVGEAVVATTPDGRIVYINSAAERLFGWRAIEVIGRSHQDVCAQVPEQAADIRSSVMTGKRYSGRLELFRRDGSQFFAHVTTEAALDEHGAVIGIVAVISDQTEPAQLERDARTRQLQAETLAVLGAQALRQRLDPRSPPPALVVSPCGGGEIPSFAGPMEAVGREGRGESCSGWRRCLWSAPPVPGRSGADCVGVYDPDQQRFFRCEFPTPNPP